ncbi:carboxypeptidase-like regulatory domain-containing protein [Actinoplanes sp. NPDC049596]|uniref:carboxypeptidase-like regulatory domain-containing protein n=1 Tax=unclassified Actinoplanes TaxID=2626549 RepID=UPI0034393F45
MHRRQVITTALAAIVATTAFAAPAQAAESDGDTGVITGLVTTPNGRPAAGITVTVDDTEIARPFTTTTAADGRYSIEVPAGDAYVVSFVNGHLRQYSPRVTSYEQARVYTVVEGRKLRVNERLLRTATLTGHLADENGAPVAGATVGIINTETANEFQTTTAADGSFRFEKLAPGSVKVSFHALDGRRQWAHQKATYDEADAYTLRLGRVTTVNDSLLAQ